MAGRTEVVLEFVGEDGRLVKTLRNVEQRAGSVLGVIGKLGKVGAGASGFLGMANSAMTLGGALTTVAPAALALPGILAGVAVATQTAKLAFAGFSDAVKGDAEALAKFGAEGQAAVKAVQGLDGGFQEMRKAVSEEMFRGLAPEIKKTGAALLDVGTTALPRVSAAFGEMGITALQAARTDFFTEDLTGIIDNTAAGLGNMNGTLANALTGFVGLGGVGATYLPALGAGIDSVAAKFKAWVDRGVESGSIKAMIDGAIEGFRQLGQLIGAVGSTVATLAQGINAGLGAGATPLTLLTDKVRTFQAALASPEGQAALAMLGGAIRAISDAFNAVLPHVLAFAFQLSGVVLPAITSFAQVVAENGQMFAGLIIGIVGLVAVVKTLIGIAAIVRTAIAAWTIAQTVLNFVMAANPIGLIVIAIAALVAALIWAWTSSETFRNIVIGAWEAIKAGASALVDGVVAAFNWFVSLPGLAAQWFGGFVASVLQKGAEFLAYIQSIPGRVMNFLGNLGNYLLNAGKALIQGFWDGVKSTWNSLVAWFEEKLAWFRGLWPFSPAKWGPFSGTGYVTYSGKALVGDFADSLAAGMPAVGQAAEGLMGAAAVPLGGSPLSGAGLPAPRAASSGGTVRVELVVGAGADSGLATLIAQMVRTGKLQLRTV